MAIPHHSHFQTLDYVTMNVWVTTRDKKIIALVGNALRVRWPNSGKMIVPSTIDSDIPDGIQGCDLAVVDMCVIESDPCLIIRTIRHNSDVPILILSDPKADQKITAKALADGAVDYLFKPIKIVDMIFRMESVTKVHLTR
jgi:DNA-binding response OmpR family regulator